MNNRLTIFLLVFSVSTLALAGGDSPETRSKCRTVKARSKRLIDESHALEGLVALKHSRSNSIAPVAIPQPHPVPAPKPAPKPQFRQVFKFVTLETPRTVTDQELQQVLDEQELQMQNKRIHLNKCIQASLACDTQRWQDYERNKEAGVCKQEEEQLALDLRRGKAYRDNRRAEWPREREKMCPADLRNLMCLDETLVMTMQEVTPG